MQAFNLTALPFFQWLLKTSLQASVLICLIFFVKSVLRGRLAIRWYYYLWLLLLVRLAIPWVPHSRISVFNLVPEHSWPRRAEIASRAGGTKLDSVRAPEGIHDAIAPATGQSAPDADKPGAILSDGGDSTRPVTGRLVATLPLAWLAGVLGLAGYIAARNYALWRAIKRERPVTDQAILDLLEDCKMQMRVQTIVGVIVTDSVRSPALFGFVRPRLLLPQGLIEALDAEELHHIFLHELAHLKRRDIYLGWLVSLLQVMHWFNPLVWLALRRMRADQEVACDRLVLSTMDPDEPAKYGRTIVNLFERFSQISYVPSIAGILEDSSQLERRIKMIANPDKKSRARSVGAMFILAALSCVALTDANPSRSMVDSLEGKVPARLRENVLLYLSFDRDGGTRAVDISGMDFHGKLHGCEYTKEGRRGGAMSFNGVDDHVSIPGIKLQAFTFSAWVRTDTEDLNNRRLFLLDSGDQYYAVQGTARGDVELSGAGFEQDDPEPIQTREFAVNEWVFVTATFDGDAFRVYKNGIPARSGRNVHGGLTGTVHIGGTDKYRGGFWHGAMDEAAIFNRALTADEIEGLYNIASGLTERPLFNTRPTFVDGEQGSSRFEGVWTGLAVDKPEHGTSKDGLTIELGTDESGLLAGVASGEFINDGYCKLKNVRHDGGRISFEVTHRFQNMRMGITLELTDGTLQGEGIPIDLDDDHCDITLRRQSSRRPVSRATRPGMSGPVVHYSFDNSQGLLVTDQSGRGHHGNVHGATYEPNGRVGGAMSFDGLDDHISTDNISLREFTFSAWVKMQTTSVNNRRIFLLSDGVRCYALQCNVGGSVGVYVADDVEVNEYDWAFELGRWTHVTVTHDGILFKIYRDGKLTQTGRIETAGVTGTLYIGGTDRHRGGFWHGMIDELFIFDHALSDSEVQRLYGPAAGTGVGPSPASPRPRLSSLRPEASGPASLEGTWSGMATDRPAEGNTRDSLAIELKVDESGRPVGAASGGFVRGDRAELKNLNISGNRISFEVAHRIANLRMKVSLELEDGRLKGEGLPIDFPEDSCDIVLQRASSR